ncbi:hypothetical protein L873DRAFT_1787183 [Choiromyces venosus 120613-1]|uniref:Uncharacterized protein n=1 Tax=Choiromyces venosus 120613-1 TaxID=1336337 RepID=A0A3N4JXD5_9PEZI|nr:hypothetical protein L873DRAFT_1787183 [Choiromyces venosus 120613-1]
MEEHRSVDECGRKSATGKNGVNIVNGHLQKRHHTRGLEGWPKGKGLKYDPAKSQALPATFNPEPLVSGSKDEQAVNNRVSGVQPVASSVQRPKVVEKPRRKKPTTWRVQRRALAATGVIPRGFRGVEDSIPGFLVELHPLASRRLWFRLLNRVG